MATDITDASDSDANLLDAIKPAPDVAARSSQLALATEFSQAFLAASCDGSAGARLYELLTPDAPVFRAGAWQPKQREAIEEAKE